MTVYLLLQHSALALALALCAACMPGWFRLAAWPRALLAASMTPQVIGAATMGLALLDVRSSAVYAHAPMVLAGVLLSFAGWRARRWTFHFLLRRPRFTRADSMLVTLGALLAVQLMLLLASNARTLNVMAHDFNVYMAAARHFAAAPGAGSMADFHGVTGQVIVVHPHSFIYEAYLSHPLMLAGPDPSVPSLDFAARVAQQLTLVYMLLALAGLTLAMGGGTLTLAALCLAVCIPWVHYIAASLSRDGFRMAPVLALVAVLASLTVNFRSHLVPRGLLAGAFAALAVMSHTLGLLLSATMGFSILAFALLVRRPRLRALSAYLLPLVAIAALAVVRYANNYLETGGFMGYGLWHSIYKGTWLEPLLAKRWTAPESAGSILHALLNRYGWHLQVSALAVSIFAAAFGAGRGRTAYRAVCIGFWLPLSMALSGLLEYAGIGLRNALFGNVRYALSFFLLPAPVLAAGLVLAGRRCARMLPAGIPVKRFCAFAVLAVSAGAAWLAHQSLLAPLWRSQQSATGTIGQIQLLHRASTCLKPGQHWFVDWDGWDQYFGHNPPLFAVTVAGRPLLTATDPAAAKAAMESMNIKLAAFLEFPALWRDRPLYQFLERNWTRLELTGSDRPREVWIAPDVADCARRHASAAAPVQR